MAIKMRELSRIESKTVFGASSYLKIEQFERNWEFNEDAPSELEMYVIQNHPTDIPLFRGLSYGLRLELGELYFRTTSYEDAFWRTLKWGSIAILSLGASSLTGFAAGRLRS